MERKDKTISMRVSGRDLESLDELSRDLIFFSRSDLIYAAIRLITHPLFKPFVYRLARFNPGFGRNLEKIDIEFNY